MKKIKKAMYGKTMMQGGGSAMYTNTTPGEISKPTMKRGGASKIKKYEEGGRTGIFSRIFKGKAEAKEAPGSPAVPTNQQVSPSTQTPKSQSIPSPISRKIDKVAKRLAKGKVGGSYKTGGMVNSNSKVSALKSAGSKGVKSGVNPKTSASKVAKGKVGGTSKAPKTAVPKKK